MLEASELRQYITSKKFVARLVATAALIASPILAACSSDSVDSRDNIFNQNITQSLSAGLNVNILKTTIEVTPAINRRRWNAVEDSLFPGRSNLAYTDRWDRVQNPIFLDQALDGSDSLNNGTGWIVYFRSDNKAIAVGIDDDTNQNILADGGVGIRRRLPNPFSIITNNSSAL